MDKAIDHFVWRREDDIRASILEVTTQDVPRGCLPQCQTFPPNFDSWSEEKKNEWLDGTARATYMAQCAFARKITRELGDIIRAILKDWEKERPDDTPQG